MTVTGAMLSCDRVAWPEPGACTSQRRLCAARGRSRWVVISCTQTHVQWVLPGGFIARHPSEEIVFSLVLRCSRQELAAT